MANIKKTVPALLLLALGSVIFYLIGGFGFSIIYLMLWIDKIIFGELKSPLYLGFELYSLPTILVGIMYGPLNGFLFGFFVVPIVLGMIDLIYTLLLGGIWFIQDGNCSSLLQNRLL